jgi:hypothetical protein
MASYGKGTGIELTTSEQTPVTITLNRTAVLKEISVCNFTGSPATFTVWIVPSGESTDLQYLVVNAESVSANDTVFKAFSTALNSEDEIIIQASANTTLSAHFSWVEFD